MNTVFSELPPLLFRFLESSGQATLLVLLVLAVQRLLGRQLTPAWRHGLWWIVVGRLLLPVTPPSPWSLFNLLPFRLTTQLPNAPSSHESDGGTSLRRNHGASADGNARNVDPLTLSPRDRNFEGASNLAGLTGWQAITAEAGLPAPTTTTQTRPLTDPSFTPVSEASDSGSKALAVVWAMGAVVLIARLVKQNLQFARRIRQTMRPANPEHFTLLEKCREQMRVRHTIQLLQGDAVSSPAIYCFLRPRLLLPSAVASTSTPETLRHIFLHELAHVRRGDLLAHAMLRLLHALHWFNPVLHWAFRRIRADRELATDALALHVAGETEARAYGMTIVAMLENFAAAPAQPGTVGMVEDNASLERRIRAIADYRPPSRWAPMTALLVVALAAASWTSAQPPAPPEPTPPDPTPAPLPAAPLRRVVATTVPLDSNAVPLLSDIPWIGRLYRKDGPEADRQQFLESIRTSLAKAKIAQTNQQIAPAALSFELAFQAATHLGTPADPERLEAIQGIQSARLELAQRAYDRGLLHEANAHLDRIRDWASDNRTALVLRQEIRKRFDARHRRTEFPPALSKIDPDPEVAQADQSIDDAAGLLGAGEFARAREIIERVIRTTPNNPRATLIEKQILDAQTNSGTRPTAVPEGKGRNRILSRLESIRIPEIGFDRIPLEVVVRRLKDIAQAQDPDGNGINFFINPYLDNVPADGGKATIDPNTLQPIPVVPKEPVPLGDVLVRIEPPLRDVSLVDVVRAVTQAVETPIDFTVEDYAVVFIHKRAKRAQLVTRVFKVDPERIAHSFGNIRQIENADPTPSPQASSPSATLHDKVRQFFEKLGVSLLPPNAVFFKESSGLLMVRATIEEIETIENAIEALNEVPQPPKGPSPESDARLPQPSPASTPSNIEPLYNEFIAATKHLQDLLTRHGEKWPSVIEAQKRVDELRFQLSRSKVNPPRTSPKEPEVHQLLIDPNGLWWLNGRQVKELERKDRLRELANDPTTAARSLRISAEPSLPWASLVAALDLAKEAGIQNVNVTEVPVPSSGDSFQLVDWKPSSDLPKTPQTGPVPVLVAFVADWSIDSGINQKVLQSFRVQRLFESSRTELYRVDGTRDQPATRALMEAYGIQNLPGYTVYHPARKSWAVLPHPLTEEAIQKALTAE